MSSTRQLASVLAIAVISTAQADTIYVDVNCPGPGDGSEADPYCSIQTAVDNAVDTDEIEVAPGTYFEAIDFDGRAIRLYSAGGPDVTTINGAGADHVVRCDSNEGPDTILEGFTITGGNANGNLDFPNAIGGGMLNLESSPTVTSCTFSGNSAKDWGGGMANYFGSPTVTNCLFIGNVAGGGGGMAALVGNSMVTDCTFSGNLASEGGGMVIGQSNATVTGCVFTGNVGERNGGGMIIAVDSIPTVTDCIFSGNSANYGGGMCNSDSNPTVIGCAFSSNIATFGGGMCNFGISMPVINCTFTGNSAAVANAVYFDYTPSDVTLTNCILWDGGDEIWNNNGSSIDLSYCDVQGGFPGTGNIDADPLFVSASLSSCCVPQSSSGCDDPDCEAVVCDVLPFCCDSEWVPNCAILAIDMCSICSIDSRLQPNSPCIDTGDNAGVPMGVLRDLDGNPRFVADACAGDSGATVDMGAYEFQGTSCDLSNVASMLAAWGGCADCRRCRYDLDGDCWVGILDLLVLLGNLR